jgi:hypothetical protein
LRLFAFQFNLLDRIETRVGLKEYVISNGSILISSSFSVFEVLIVRM